MLTVVEAAKTETYRRARASSYGVTDAIEQVRSSYAYRRAAIETCEKAARTR